jgi:glutathione S-transferase
MSFKLYSAWYCPFAQRAWMTLLYKELAFDYVEVDPFRASQWWLDISRHRATVPVLVTSAEPDRPAITVVDSTRVVEYLDERTPGFRPLFASDPDSRAEQRFWVDQINEHIVPYVYRYLGAAEAGETRENARAALLEGLETFANAMSPHGPFFAGESLSAIDLLMIPFAYRIDALLGHYRGFTVPTAGTTWKTYARWYRQMRALDVFKATATDHDDYRDRLIDHYLPYSRGEQQA